MGGTENRGQGTVIYGLSLSRALSVILSPPSWAAAENKGKPNSSPDSKIELAGPESASLLETVGALLGIRNSEAIRIIYD